MEELPTTASSVHTVHTFTCTMYLTWYLLERWSLQQVYIRVYSVCTVLMSISMSTSIRMWS
jgi:hypothetical protein